MFSDDDEDGDHMDIVIKDPIQFPRAESPSPCAITTAIGPNTPFLNLDGNALDSSSHRTPNEIYAFSIGPLVKITPSTTPQRSGLFSGHEDNISLINQLKDTVTSSKPEGADLDIQGKAKLLGAPNSEKEQTNNMKMALTPPRSPMKSTLKAQITSPASTVSTLPRTLSNSSDPDKDMGIKVKTPQCFDVSVIECRRLKVLPRYLKTHHQSIRRIQNGKVQRFAAWRREPKRVPRRLP